MRILLALALGLTTVSTQAQEIVREAISSGGGIFQSASVELSVSYGQFAVITLQQSPSILTQGFQQNDRNPCYADLNNDGIVNTGDLVILLSNIGCLGSGCIGNLNSDSEVNTGDVVALLSVFGTICP